MEESNVLRVQKLPSKISKRVLVTGALGFVGSEVCRQLLSKESIEVFAVDNESKGSLSNIKGLKVNYLKGDIRNNNDINDIFNTVHPDVVIHLAAMHYIPDCNRDPAQCLHVNVVGTENMLNACRKTNVVRALITSSMAVYPIKDNANLETDTADPYDVYGESKVANELQARRFHYETGIDTVAVRLTNVYGPRETNPHVIPEIMEQLKAGNTKIKLGNIEPKRDFIHTTDAASGFLALAFTPIARGFHIVNLGSGREYSIRQVLDELSSILGYAVEPVHDPSRYRNIDRMHLLCDITCINKLVGWSPAMNMKEGLKNLCKWYGLI